jgi:hypothetical protein
MESKEMTNNCVIKRVLRSDEKRLFEGAAMDQTKAAPP